MDYKEVLRVMKKSNLITKSLLDKAELKVTSREEILGLEYRGGEEVIDSVTGRRGKIDSGSTAYITKV